MRSYASIDHSSTGRSESLPDRRGLARGRAAGQRPCRADGHPPVGGVATPPHPGGSRVRSSPARRSAALVFSAARAIPRAQRVGQPVPRIVGRPSRRVWRGARTQTTGTPALPPHTEETMTDTLKASTGNRITLERTYRAELQDVWDLWTTKDGIESWWGPGGFAVTVRKLDLRPGGQLLYAMTAIDPPQIEFLK